MSESNSLDPQRVHEMLMRRAPRVLAFREGLDLARWRDDLRRGLRTTLGEAPAEVPLQPKWSPWEERETFRVRRVVFQVEEGAAAVGWLVTPREVVPGGVEGGRPTVICLQGHSSGAYVSLGEIRHPDDPGHLADDHDYARQAVDHGFNAFVLEQRAFGERSDGRPVAQRGHYDPDRPFTDERCRHQAMVALLLGRTLMGERVHDVSRAVTLLEELPEVDPRRIGCMGNSGGGSTTWYAAAMDERIAAVMPGCSVCSYEMSIGRIDHCSDNYLPGALAYFDMGDLAGLIAPRPLVLVAGDEDPIFPYEGVLAGEVTIRSVYRAFGAGDRVTLHTGHGGHRFYRDAWRDFANLTGW
jgi:dienelactone hydrolase